MEAGKPICAFIHSDPGSIPAALTEKEPQIEQKLRDFRHKVAEGRIVKMWKNKDELPGLVVLSLSHAIKRYPTPGWVRGDQVSSLEMFTELDALRKENEALKAKKASNKIRYDEKHIEVLYSDKTDDDEDFVKPVRSKLISVGDLIEIVPTSQVYGQIQKSYFESTVTEKLFGFSSAMDIVINRESWTDIYFILEQLNLIVIDGYEIGFTTKFRRAKLELSFDIKEY